VLAGVNTHKTSEIRTVSGEEGDGSAGLASAARSANAMDVVLRVVGVVIVEHVRDVAHILRGMVSNDGHAGHGNVPARTGDG